MISRRDLTASALTLLDLYTLRQAQANLFEDKRACRVREKQRPDNRGPAIPDILAEAQDQGDQGPASIPVSSANRLQTHE